MTIIDDDKVIDLATLLSQPLISTLEADFYTAQRFVEFMTDYGLEKADNVPSEEGENAALSEVSGSRLSGSLKLKMVTFLYRQIDPSDRQEKVFRIQVPLISLIPLPLLQIDRAEFDFNIRIFSKIDLSTPIASSGGLIGEKISEGQFKGFQARLSPIVGRSESGENGLSLDANMKIKIQMRQADLPGGLAYWMSTFTQATSVNPLPLAQLDIIPSTLLARDPTSGDQSLLVAAALFDEKGMPVSNQDVTITIDGTPPINPKVELPSPATLKTNNNGTVQFIIIVKAATAQTPPVRQPQQEVKLRFSSTTPAASNKARLIIPEFMA